jgi:hypothetical protein
LTLGLHSRQHKFKDFSGPPQGHNDSKQTFKNTSYTHWTDPFLGAGAPGEVCIAAGAWLTADIVIVAPTSKVTSLMVTPEDVQLQRSRFR